MINQPLKHELTLSDREFNDLAKFIKEKLGIVLGSHKKELLHRRLSKRIKELQLETFEGYHQFLLAHEDESSVLANAITTNLTSFFREGHHFEHLSAYLKGHFAKNKTLTVWSAGSSKGCEVYSIAMTILDVLGGNTRGYTIKILATDIDTDMLDIGSSGKYEMELLEKIPKEYHKYLQVGQETFQLNSELTSMVSFKKLNLLEDWPMRKKFDVIFCRNTMIYFDKDTQKILFHKFADLLKSPGHLYIGHSENMGALCDKFIPCGRTIYQLKGM